MALLMEAAGVTVTMEDAMTSATNLLVHVEDMETMREKVVATSCEVYLACKFLLLTNGERCKPMWTHLENEHTEENNP